MKHVWEALRQNLQKSCKLGKSQIFVAKPSFLAKNVQKTKSARTVINYTFLRNPLPGKFEYVNFIISHLCKNQRKMSLQKLCNLLAFVKGFPKSYTLFKSKDWR